jgi:hypothetical protein
MYHKGKHSWYPTSWHQAYEAHVVASLVFAVSFVARWHCATCVLRSHMV